MDALLESGKGRTLSERRAGCGWESRGKGAPDTRYQAGGPDREGEGEEALQEVGGGVVEIWAKIPAGNLEPESLRGDWRAE